MRVAVVGGGITGLSIAHALAGRTPDGEPIDLVVLEAATRPGGNLRTEHVDGYTCEWGPNGFLDNSPPTLALVESLGLRSRLTNSDDRARRRFIYRRGRLHEVPLGPVGFFTSGLLSVRGRARVACEPFAPGRPEGDETIHAFAARRIGREAADVLIDPMVSGIFGGNARELSLEACFPKMRQMEIEHGSLVRAMLARRRRRDRSAGVGAPTGRLTSFAGGVADLVEALTDALGERVRLGSRVTAIERAGNDAWRLRTADGGAAEAEAVVLAGPASSSAEIVAPLAADLASTLREIPSAPLAVVCLGYDAATLGHALEGFGFLVPRGEGIRVLGALWDSSVYPGRAPEGRALVRVMLGGAHDPDVMALDDGTLVEAALRDLRSTMSIAARPEMVRVFRHPLGIPQYTTGHLQRLARIEAHLARLPGLFVAGNSYRGVSINNCIADAGPVADAVVASGRAIRREL